MDIRRILPALVLFFLSALVQAQTGSVKGTVTTSDGKPAAFVNVGLSGTEKGASTNEKGEFEITGIEPREYTITTSHVGLEEMQQKVIVRDGEVSELVFLLPESAVQLQEVEVASDRKRNYHKGIPSQTLRTRTPILNTPQNIQVITSDLIRDQQAFDLLEGVTRNVSGAQKLEHWDNYARINMRGSQITAFRNGINVTMPWGPLAEDMSMVDRIEFVKGPAGFMLSSGEPGGFYNVVTKKPTGVRHTDLSFSLGSFNTYRGTADLDGKISNNGRLLYRLNAMAQKKGSHRDFEYNDRFSIAPVLKYLISDRTSATLEYTHQFSEMSAIGSNYAFSNRGFADLPLNFTTAEKGLDPSRITEYSVLLNVQHRFSKEWELIVQGSYLNYSMVGQSLWPWGFDLANDSIMQRGISIWDALGINQNAQAFVNGKVRTGGVSHAILAGVDLSEKDYYADWSQAAALGSSDFNIYAPVYGTVNETEFPEWDRSIDLRSRPATVWYNDGYAGFYAQDEMGFFSDRLRITLAGRYTMLTSEDPYAGDYENSKITPRAGLSWSVLKNTSIYGLYDQSFLANPGLDWQGNGFAPITADNVEFGVKRDWAGGKWNTAVSAYRITRNNVLTTDLEHADPVTGQFLFSRQTGQQQAQGIEVDLRGRVTKDLSIVINYAYTDAMVTEDSDPEIVGNKVPGATEHIQNTWLTYAFRGKAIKGLDLSVGYQYQAGRSTWSVFDDGGISMPEYFRLDAAIGYKYKRFKFDVICNNLLDEYLYSGAPSYGMIYWQTEPGRNARLTIGYSF